MTGEIVLATLIPLAAVVAVIAVPLLASKLRDESYRRSYTTRTQNPTRSAPPLPKYARHITSPTKTPVLEYSREGDIPSFTRQRPRVPVA